MPSWGFSLAVSGRTIPLLVFSSFSTGLTTTRSPNGLRFMCSPPQLMVISTPHARALGTLAGRLLNTNTYTEAVSNSVGPIARLRRVLPHKWARELLFVLDRGVLRFL